MIEWVIDIKRRLEIWSLKRQARQLSMEIMDIQDDYYMAGAHMADVMTGGRLSSATTELTKIMARLREIDPEAPRA